MQCNLTMRMRFLLFANDLLLLTGSSTRQDLFPIQTFNINVHRRCPHLQLLQEKRI